jgi:hypothetical protein
VPAFVQKSASGPVRAARLVNLIQMLLDRGETNGYAEHLNRSRYPHTPRHRVLLSAPSAAIR